MEDVETVNGITTYTSGASTKYPVTDQPQHEVPAAGSSEFQHGLCSCCSDCGVCCCAILCSSYVAGKVGEKLGESCCIHCLAASCYPCVVRTIQRGMVREKKGIAGSTLNDCLLTCFCGCLALIQEAKEVGALSSENQVMSRE